MHSPAISTAYGWADVLSRLTEAEPRTILDALEAFVPDASEEQRIAWRRSLEVLQAQGAKVLRLRPAAGNHGTVLEYELPREGGRRPDVIVLQNGRVVVLEFKSSLTPRRADVDQVAAYARDLRHYHSACGDVDVVAALVLPAGRTQLKADEVSVIGADLLGDWLVALGGEGVALQISDFVRGEYAPLPTLVAAARMLFENLPLPFIKRAASAGVGATVEHILAVTARAHAAGERHLILLTGVPGAGKTLVGLQVAHSARLASHGVRGAPATFLSGNGPLVQVLQDALKSRTFVRDMHGFIREHGLKHPDRIPPEHVILFDEAQRAWDAEKVQSFYGAKPEMCRFDLNRSEPQLLAEIAQRLPRWSVVVGLVGTGQEIHSGEEAGIAQWAEAVRGRGWRISGPPELRSHFASEAYESHLRLSLDTTLRAHAAGHVHRWVTHLLAGDFALAEPLANDLRKAGFPIYVTRDLDRAKRYARDRFAGEPQRRYGLVASSKADRFLLRFGIDCGFQATKQLKIGPWFNHPPQSALSCCQLTSTATEFQTQGLEMDLPIVCWGDDVRVRDGGWELRPRMRTKDPVRDMEQLRKNAYRVLLTRGREGLVLFVPRDPLLEETHAALVRAGARSADDDRRAVA